MGHGELRASSGPPASGKTLTLDLPKWALIGESRFVQTFPNRGAVGWGIPYLYYNTSIYPIPNNSNY
jgi:hypothetical protein